MPPPSSTAPSFYPGPGGPPSSKPSGPGGPPPNASVPPGGPPRGYPPFSGGSPGPRPMYPSGNFWFLLQKVNERSVLTSGTALNQNLKHDLYIWVFKLSSRSSLMVTLRNDEILYWSTERVGVTWAGTDSSSSAGPTASTAASSTAVVVTNSSSLQLSSGKPIPALASAYLIGIFVQIAYSVLFSIFSKTLNFIWH